MLPAVSQEFTSLCKTTSILIVLASVQVRLLENVENVLDYVGVGPGKARRLWSYAVPVGSEDLSRLIR